MIGSPTEEIKARLDIVEFIQSYARLQKAGVNFRAPCPFHAEKTPSFFVSPARQTWHCFGGCGEGGDIFKFVMKIEGLDFPEALRLLAARAGVELRREDPRLASERRRLYEVCEEAAKIFEKNLLLSPAPKEYLKKRGITESTVRGFRIGWAPESWDSLLLRLAKKGFKSEEAGKSGLAVRRGPAQTGMRTSADKFLRESASHPHESAYGWHDRFRSRIMFPIADANGRIIGFGGRILETGNWKLETGSRSPASSIQNLSSRVEAKYINTPQTLIYDKSRVLYGFDKAKQEMRARNRAVIVEGYMDCVMSHQAGVKNTIAVSGTALTHPQLKIIKRLCDTAVFSFDTDAAGETATRRSLALAAEFEFERKIAAIPAGKDPADAALENPAQWIAAVEEAKPVIDFYFDKMFREENPERAEGKKKISAALIPLIADLPDEIQKAHWVRELAKRFAMGEDAIWKETARKPTGARDFTADIRNQNHDSPSAAPLSRRELLEDRFLSLIAVMPDDRKEAVLAAHHPEFSSASRQEMFSALVAASPELPPHLADAAQSLRFKGEAIRELGGNMERELALCRRELEIACIRARRARLGEEIRVSEQGGSGSPPGLLDDFDSLSEQEQLKTAA